MLSRRFNGLSRASQVHSSGNYSDIMPINNQAYYKSGIMPPERHEIKGVGDELWLRVKLE